MKERRGPDTHCLCMCRVPQKNVGLCIVSIWCIPCICSPLTVCVNWQNVWVLKNAHPIDCHCDHIRARTLAPFMPCRWPCDLVTMETTHAWAVCTRALSSSSQGLGTRLRIAWGIESRMNLGLSFCMYVCHTLECNYFSYQYTIILFKLKVWHPLPFHCHVCQSYKDGK